MGLNRYQVKCSKCGYEWYAHTAEPKRCALCNNPNIRQPKVKGLKRVSTNVSKQ